MQCPVCEKHIDNENERLCPQCGWEFKFYLTGMTEEEEAFYNRKLEMARSNWRELTTGGVTAKKLEQELGRYRKKLKDIEAKEANAGKLIERYKEREVELKEEIANERSKSAQDAAWNDEAVDALKRKVLEIEEELARQQKNYKGELEKADKKVAGITGRETETRRSLEELKQRERELRRQIEEEKTKAVRLNHIGHQSQEMEKSLRKQLKEEQSKTAAAEQRVSELEHELKEEQSKITIASIGRLLFILGIVVLLPSGISLYCIIKIPGWYGILWGFGTIYATSAGIFFTFFNSSKFGWSNVFTILRAMISVTILWIILLALIFGSYFYIVSLFNFSIAELNAELHVLVFTLILSPLLSYFCFYMYLEYLPFKRARFKFVNYCVDDPLISRIIKGSN